MLWLWTDAGYAHINDPNSIALPKSLVRKIWGSDAVMRNVLGRNYFSVSAGTNVSESINYSNSFRPNAELLEALLLCLLDLEPVSLLSGSNQPTCLSKNAFSSRRKDGNSNSSWSTVKACRLVPINVENLYAFLMDDANDIQLQKAAWRIIRLANNAKWPGHLPVLYEEVKTGRIFETNFHLQNNPRAVTKACFAGNWDYDISNCHFSILSEWARSLGLSAPVIGDYLSKKKEIRASLAAHCLPELEPYESISLVKQSLLSLIYGASLNGGQASSLIRCLGVQGALKFKDHEFVIKLKREIMTLSRHIINDLPENQGFSVNCMGIKAGSKDSKKVLSHALQGVEALILKRVALEYGEDLLLFMHDGWVSRRRLDIEHIQLLIKEVTCFSGRDGFNMSLEETYIEPIQQKNNVGMQTQSIPNLARTPLVARIEELIVKVRASNTPRVSGGLVLSNTPEWNRDKHVHGPTRRKLLKNDTAS